MKKILCLCAIMFTLFLSGCLVLSSAKTITIVSQPKTIYEKGEEVNKEAFKIEVTLSDGTIKSFFGNDPLVTFSNFQTTNVGSFIGNVSAEGLTASFEYEVVNAIGDLFAGGSGTEENPYMISNQQQLLNVNLIEANNYTTVESEEQVQKVFRGQKTYYKLKNDIDLSNTEVETSYFIKEFCGSLDGDNHSIKGVKKHLINNCYNITLKNTTIYLSNAAAVCNSMKLGKETDLNVFDNNKLYGSVETGATHYGTFVRYAHSANFKINFINCTNNVNVSGTGGANQFISGFIGITALSTVRFEGCVNNGNLQGYNTVGVGNGFDYGMSATYITVVNCVNTGHLLYRTRGIEVITPGDYNNSISTKCVKLGTLQELFSLSDTESALLVEEDFNTDILINHKKENGVVKYIVNLSMTCEDYKDSIFQGNYPRSLVKTFYVNSNEDKTIDTTFDKLYVCEKDYSWNSDPLYSDSNYFTLTDESKTLFISDNINQTQAINKLGQIVNVYAYDCGEADGRRLIYGYGATARGYEEVTVSVSAYNSYGELIALESKTYNVQLSEFKNLFN